MAPVISGYHFKCRKANQMQSNKNESRNLFAFSVLLIISSSAVDYVNVDYMIVISNTPCNYSWTRESSCFI